MTDNNVEALREDLARALAVRTWGEAAAVVVLLDFKPIAGDERFGQHVYRNGVDWDGLLGESWSTGERFLIASAAGLWTGRAHDADVSLLRYLADEFRAAWLAMVTAAGTGVVPRAGESTAGA